MKKLIAISAMTMLITTCGYPVMGSEQEPKLTSVTSKQSIDLATKFQKIQQQSFNLDKQTLILKNNSQLVKAAIKKLRKHIGKTWYVFSGSSPSGWDCSGLVRWTYKQVGITLEHRASKQRKAGTEVRSPKPGDIVAFTYKNTKSAYHVGIYISQDKMIHVKRRGTVTSIDSISKFAGKGSSVAYIRLLETF